ncbi:MAG: ATP-binding protein [Alphaproteobacteria bacterium]
MAQLLSVMGYGLKILPQNALVAVLVLVAIVSGVATYGALNEMPPFGNDPDTVIWLLTLDLVLLLSLVSLIAKRIVAIWSGRKRGLAGSHLHVRLVSIFSLMAAIPVVIMGAAFVFFYYYGVQSWFSQRVQTAVDNSQAVAEAYLEEHKQVIRADTLAMASDLNRQASFFMANEAALSRAVRTQSVLRNLSEVMILDSSKRVLARSDLTFSLEFETIPEFAMQQVEDGEVALMTGSNEDRVRALVKLDNFFDAYLFVGRMVDPKVLSHLSATREASEDYTQLKSRLSRLQIIMTMIFVMVGLLLLFSAIWFGFVLARQLVNPISELITNADRVRAGDLSARVQEFGTIEEFDYLARAFNRMTTQVEEQQGALIDANRQMDQRRLFTETVLAGVSSGVIGVNAKNKITIANQSAAEYLGLNVDKIIGKKLSKIIAEFDMLLTEAKERPQKITQREITVKINEQRIFFVRIGVEKIGKKDYGAVITFDDITELQSAQRKAAWADVARRIAHEIKNPLTPIQLSAERLRRKYLDQITTDPETFAQCTDTIVKHVEDIGRMVDEFSAFARMPEPVKKRQPLAPILEDALSLHQNAHVGIQFTSYGLDGCDALANVDAPQIRQALNNLIQNAVDSVMAQDKKGCIHLFVTRHDGETLYIGVQDNGVGLPEAETPERLTEPYITHKEKGTGLGLAIVKKIMEDHDGEVIIGTPPWLKNCEGYEKLGGAAMGLLVRIENA